MTTSVKTCFKCDKEKPLADFYKHPQMGDGHLNKCKACTRADSAAHRRSPRFREKVLAYDRKRGNRRTPQDMQNYRKENRKETRARSLVSSAVRCGRLDKPDRCSHCHTVTKIVGHHPNYDKPLEVVWLCHACHNQLHALLDTVETKLVCGQLSARNVA